MTSTWNNDDPHRSEFSCTGYSIAENNCNEYFDYFEVEKEKC